MVLETGAGKSVCLYCTGIYMGSVLASFKVLMNSSSTNRWEAENVEHQFWGKKSTLLILFVLRIL